MWSSVTMKLQGHVQDYSYLRAYIYDVFCYKTLVGIHI